MTSSALDRLNDQLDRAANIAERAKSALRQDLRADITAAKNCVDRMFDEMLKSAVGQELRARITRAKRCVDRNFDELLADAEAKADDLVEEFRAQLAWANSIQNIAEAHYERTITGLMCELTLTSVDIAAFDPRGYFVYLLWGDDPDTPIYVGQSRNVLSRLAAHMRDNTKREMMRRLQLIRCPDQQTMDSTERVLIRKYQPPLNNDLMLTP